MATIVTRTANGAALSTAQMDANLTNLNNDKIEAVSDDSSPALGGNLDVGSNSITTTTTNGNIAITPNGTGLVVVPNLKIDSGAGSGTISTGTGNINLLPGASGAVNIQGDQGLQVTGDGTDAYIFTASTNSNLTLYANGTGVIGIGSPVYIENNPIATSQTNGDITITPNGTGKLKVSTGIDVVGGGITTSTTNGDITVTGNGTGIINLNGTVEISDLQAYAEKIEVLASVSGTLTIDATAGPLKYVVPGGNCTINGFSSPVAGQTVSLLFDQSTYSTSFTLTLGASVLTPGGSGVTLTATGNDLVTITCIDDATPVYIATSVANFQ